MLELFERLRNLGSIKRCNVFRKLCDESVAEHSYFTALTCMLVADELSETGVCKPDVEKLLRAAILHDVDELVTSDIPYHIKHNNDDIHREISKVQRQAFSEVFSGLSGKYVRMYNKINEEQKSDTPEGKILALVDKFDLVIYCFQEIRLGNWYFRGLLHKAISILKGMEYYRDSSLIKSSINTIMMMEGQLNGS